ncbi:MAG: hypothetical protein ACTHLN_03995, partial [Tepidisphaeraceae bacterium]
WDEAACQKMFDLATAHLFAWQQSEGSFGSLLLHGVWGEASTLSRRYHGKTAANSTYAMQGAMTLFERTREVRWRLLADAVIGNLLYLQTPAGGFFHASGEFEPTFTAEQSCPIHQCQPILTLLAYTGWKHAEPLRARLAKEAIDRHWEWFRNHWFNRGNTFQHPTRLPGYCGVTNQDLVVVACLAAYARQFGDTERYERYGRPVLDTYLSPSYYYPETGLFERGDKANFVERTSYQSVNVPMLARIHADMPDDRIPGVIDNVSAHLFDTIVTGADGLTHLANGATTDPVDKSRVLEWVETPHSFTSYFTLLKVMRTYAERHGDIARLAQCDALERTIQAYVFADGSTPTSLGGADPLFTVGSRCEYVWLYLIDRLGDRLRSPRPVTLPRLKRVCGNVTFLSDATHWALYRDGVRAFAGIKREPNAIAIGPSEPLVDFDPARFDEPDVLEIL